VHQDGIRSPSVVRLARELTSGAAAGALVPELERWLAASARFREFATANGSKLRKKLRGAADPETLRDVRAEILVARLVLEDRRAALAWEPLGARTTGPDFTLTIPGLRPVNLEVTRLRRDPADVDAGVPWLAKLRQLPPGSPNAIVVAIDGGTAAELDVARSVQLVRARADAKDEAWFTARGFAGSRAFYDRFLRLGAVFAWCEGAVGDDRSLPWRNGSARIAVPDRVAGACLTALRLDA
jgi:hypothetical protein